MEDTGDGEADSIETEASTPIEQRLSPMPSAQQGESEPITIGTLLPLTGELKQFGPDMQRAVELAAEDINNAGILSQEIEIAQGDSQTDDAQAPQELNRLINQEDIVGFVGAASSGVSGSVIEQAVSNEIAMVTPASTSPALTERQNDGFFFRVVPNDMMQGQVMAQTLEEDGVESVSTLYVNNDYGQGFNDVLVDEFNGSVVNEVGFDNDETQFSSQVTQVSSDDPDATVVVAYPGNAVPIMDEAFSQGVTSEQKFYFSEGVFSEDFLGEVGEDEEGNHVIAGCMGTTPQILLDPGPQSFQERFNETYDHRPGLFAAQSYDATVAMALGIAYSDSADPSEFKQGMREVWNAPGQETSNVTEALTLAETGQDIDWEGPSGAFDWNEDNEPIRGLYGVWKVTEDGGFEIVRDNIEASMDGGSGN